MVLTSICLQHSRRRDGSKRGIAYFGDMHDACTMTADTGLWDKEEGQPGTGCAPSVACFRMARQAGHGSRAWLACMFMLCVSSLARTAPRDRQKDRCVRALVAVLLCKTGKHVLGACVFGGNNPSFQSLETVQHAMNGCRVAQNCDAIAAKATGRLSSSACFASLRASLPLR